MSYLDQLLGQGESSRSMIRADDHCQELLRMKVDDLSIKSLKDAIDDPDKEDGIDYNDKDSEEVRYS